MAPQYSVALHNLQPGKLYHFSLKDKKCCVGEYVSQSKININDEEWLVKIKDGTLLLKSQIVRVHPVHTHLPSKI